MRPKQVTGITLTEKLPRLAGGAPGLDDVLGGGFVEGASYIIQGQPGAGKTILANQVAFSAVRAGRKVLYVTLLAETHDRLFQSLGILDFFDHSRLGNGIAYVSVFQTLREEGLAAVVSLLRQETRRQGATLLIFDGLLNARDRAETDIDVKTFVAEVQSQAAFVGCTVLFLTSSRLSDNSPEHTMVDGVIELFDELQGVRSARRLQVRKSRGSSSLGGHHQFEIGSTGITIFPRLEAKLATPSVADRPTPSRVPSGVEGLDDLFQGGIPEGSITLVCGPSGSGKTSLGLDFVSAGDAAEPAMVFGFYETPERLLFKADALGIPLRRLAAAGHVDLLWRPMTEHLIDKLAYEVLSHIRSRGIKRLVIDALTGFERATPHKERLVEFFAAFFNELRALGVTSLVISEVPGPVHAHDLVPGPEIFSLIDNLIMLKQVPDEEQVKRAISLLKVRDGAFEPTPHEFIIGNQGLKVAFPRLTAKKGARKLEL